MPHFLIVDDEAAVAATLARMLEVAAHRVTIAGDAERGLALALEATPDAILVDMRMPGVSGIDFVRRLRRDARLREVPVGLVTGDYFVDEALLHEMQALGVTVRYKPLRLEDLIALATSLTGQKDIQD